MEDAVRRLTERTSRPSTPRKDVVSQSQSPTPRFASEGQLVQGDGSPKAGVIRYRTASSMDFHSRIGSRSLSPSSRPPETPRSYGSYVVNTPLHSPRRGLGLHGMQHSGPLQLSGALSHSGFVL